MVETEALRDYGMDYLDINILRQFSVETFDINLPVSM